MNADAIYALAEGAGVAGARRKRRDLDDIAGTWKADKALESALAAQDRVDTALWPVRVALDTDRSVDLCKAVAETVALLEEAEKIVLDDAPLRIGVSATPQQGKPIPTHDMLLAALVLQHNLVLHARDRHFDHLPQRVRV